MSDAVRRLAALPKDLRLLVGLLWKERFGSSDRPALAGAGEEAWNRPFGLISEEDRRRLPAGIEDAYPLSQVQLGMLFHMEQTLTDPTPAYHNVNSFPLRLKFDPWAFQEAVQRVVDRHPMLRTSFDLHSYDEALQLVHEKAVLPIEIVDVRHLAKDDKKGLFEEFIRERNRNVLDLGRPPLWRLIVHRWTNDRLFLTLVEPHALSDGWSTTSTLAEIFDLYLRLQKGEDVAVQPPPPFSHREYVVLERRALESGEAREFFREKLAERTISPLPRWIPPAEGFDAAQDRKPTFRVEKAVAEGLYGVSRELGIPMKTVLLAAHLKVLSVISGESDVITGWTIHGRPEEIDAEQIRGMFLNTLPLRVNLAAGTWGELIQDVLAAEIELLGFRHYPLASVQDDVGERTLFETGYSYLHFHSVEQTLVSGEVEVQAVGGSDLSVTHFPLMVTFFVNPLLTSILFVIMEYDPRTISPAQIASIRGCYQRVLVTLAKGPRARHDALSFLSPAERHQVLVEWNDPGSVARPEAGSPADPAAGCLHRLFERVAERTPDAIAVVYTGRCLTYGELARRSDALAWRLRSLGVAAGDRVGIALDRSEELVTAILGVVKAGAAYVPLDPFYPHERLRFIAQDAGVGVILTETRQAELLGELPAEMLCLDAEPRPAEVRSGHLPAVHPRQPIYVIYTSGSTGIPKGVVISHRNASRLFTAARGRMSFGERDVWTLLHSFAFDFSVWELWGALAHGGRLVVVPYDVSRSPADFSRLLTRQRVSMLSQTPSAFRSLQEAGVEPGESALRCVVFGGEALDPASLEPWFERFGDSGPRLINMYGITETTVHVTCRPLSPADARGRLSKIGRPLADLRMHILGPYGHPVPMAVPGEIHVGGAGLALGYNRRPGLTAERFIPDPFADEQGARLYASGDLARYLPDGDVQYLGRGDDQVKIRGFRIELGEIEAELARQPEVAQAVAVLREDEPGDRRLVAYLTPEGGLPPAASDLRRRLRERLPDYMVPARFVALDEFPRTASGKLDRRALPPPEEKGEEAEEAFAEPRGELELALAAIWRKVLKLDQVGVHDNFFDLGGNSLLLLKVHRRLMKRLGSEVPFLELLQFPTIHSLARHLADQEGETISFEEDEERGRRRRAASRRQRSRQRRARVSGGPGEA